MALSHKRCHPLCVEKPPPHPSSSFLPLRPHNPESKSLGCKLEKWNKRTSIKVGTCVKEEQCLSYYIIIIASDPRHVVIITASRIMYVCVCLFVCVSVCGSGLLFLAAVGPVGWGLSLSYMTREQINTKHTLDRALRKRTVWHRRMILQAVAARCLLTPAFSCRLAPVTRHILHQKLDSGAGDTVKTHVQVQAVY